MDRLVDRARALITEEEILVIAGDYNVIPSARDVYDAAAWAGDALYLPQTRARFRTLLNLGLTDALRATTDTAGRYTFWDYQAGAWQRNKGICIDHLLLSPQRPTVSARSPSTRTSAPRTGRRTTSGPHRTRPVTPGTSMRASRSPRRL